MLRFILPTSEHTATLGELLGRMARAGDVYLLTGPLGAGKTTLTQSVARGLDVPDDHYVTSPSYSLMLEYPGRIPLYHMDCYRLEGEDDVEGSGLVDYIVTDGLTVIEWPDRLGAFKPATSLDITLSPDPDGRRIVHLVVRGSSWGGRISLFKQKTRAAGLSRMGR